MNSAVDESGAKENRGKQKTIEKRVARLDPAMTVRTPVSCGGVA